MKKFVFLLGLLTTTVCLTACGSKNFSMPFEEALEIANHSELQNILSENKNFEQDFDISGSFNSKGTKIDASITSNNKQNLDNNNSESSTKFNANVTISGEALKINGTLDLKLIDDTIYLNLSSLDLTGSDNLSIIELMVAGFKNQWLSIPMTGLNEMPSSFSILKDSQKLNNKTKEIIINKGSTVYSGKFKEFNGYNAWKISLDNNKLNELIKEYYSTISGEEIEIPELNIQEFEGYLVITGKDKVTTVIENMKMQDNETIMEANGFAGEDYEINISEGGEVLVKIVAEKQGSKYEVSISLTDIILLNGTISPRISKSGINLKFDAKLTAKAEEEGSADTIIPFKGSWNYKGIPDFTISAPENAQDLSELLGAYLGGLPGGDDEDYAALYDEDSLIPNEATDIENAEEIENNGENTEDSIVTPEPEVTSETAENE